tara:strand:+ start:292 stop:513 length:222 start_codon:yes stop_codon:yes gene_type:complete
MRIRVKAEETVYLEYFVDVPEEILNLDRRRMYMQKNIRNWIDENQSEFNYQDYDSDRSWYDWEEVGEEWNNEH